MNQAQAAAERAGARRWAQKYRPAEVGYAEQISAMERPTNRVIRPTATQPQTITAGPPVFIPNRYSVRQPDRTEMIVKETA